MNLRGNTRYAMEWSSGDRASADAVSPSCSRNLTSLLLLEEWEFHGQNHAVSAHSVHFQCTIYYRNLIHLKNFDSWCDVESGCPIVVIMRTDYSSRKYLYYFFKGYGISDQRFLVEHISQFHFEEYFAKMYSVGLYYVYDVFYVYIVEL